MCQSNEYKDARYSSDFNDYKTFNILKTKKSHKSLSERIQNVNSPENSIRMQNMTAVWNQNSDNHQMKGIFNVSSEKKSGQTFTFTWALNPNSNSINLQLENI